MTQPNITTTTSTSSSNGINTIQQSSSIGSSQVVGNYATTATLQPYVAPQVLGFYGSGLRPGANVYAFFDGVNVSQYCAPAYQEQGGPGGGWDTIKYMNSRAAPWGTQLQADINGNLSGQFCVPEGKFKVGVHTLELADISDITDPNLIPNATTVAASYFTSGPLPVGKSISTPTTITPENAYLPFQSSLANSPNNTLVTLGGKSSLTDYFYEFAAQSFTIPNNLGTPGVQINSVDLFFRLKPPVLSTNPDYQVIDAFTGANTNQVFEKSVSIYICEVNNGYPDETAVLPNSREYLPKYFNHYDPTTKTDVYPAIYYPVNTSTSKTDGLYNNNTRKTTFWFNYPIYCVAGKTYAIVVRPSDNDPLWELWGSNLGQPDATTGQTSQSFGNWVGPSYYGYNGNDGNNQKWTKYDSFALKFNINAYYNPTGSLHGTAHYTERARDYLTLYNVVYPNESTLGGILPGDHVYLANSGQTNANYSDVIGQWTPDPNGNLRLHFGIVDHYDAERQILYVDTSDLENGQFWYTTDVLWPQPSLNTRFRTTGTFWPNSCVQIHRSNTDFYPYTISGGTSYDRTSGETLTSPPYPSVVYTINSRINNTSIVAYANTGPNYNPKINTVVPQFNIFTPPGTTATINYRGISNTFVYDTANTNISTINYETNLHDYERIVASRSTANIGFQDKKTCQVSVSMTSDNPWLTPVVDNVRTELLAIRNFIDPISSTYEEFYNTGSARSKYISKVVTLAEGQDSEDLQVILSAYRPPTSDIQVWVKFLSGNDSEVFGTKTWTPLKNNNVTLFCDPANDKDYKDFTFTVPQSFPLIPTTGVITTTANSTSITGAGTLFGTEVNVGWYINMSANSTVNELSRKIVSIANSTSLTIDTPFNSVYTSNAYYIVPPPTTAWLAQNTSVIVDGLVTTSTTNNAIIGYQANITANTTGVDNVNEAIFLTNANTYFNPGNKIYYQVPAGNTAIGGLTGNTWYYVKYSNTTSVSLTATANGTLINLTAGTTNPGETHQLVSTNFNYWYQPGSIIDVNGDSQVVISVANNTYLTVGAPWTTNNTNQPAYLATSAGLTYENASGAVYSTYKKFQIKIILQSDDTSKVPILNNLRALSLQL